MSQPPVRILIVEDDFLIAEGMRQACHEAGYDVVGLAAGAAEAISIAQVEQPDLALMDISLSGGSDGVETASLLRERFGIPSIFTTAYNDPETHERARLAVPAGWLTKPFAQADLVQLVHSALSPAP